MKRTLAALALVALASTARAESPRWGAFELAVGQYRPDIDSEFTTRKPFAEAFGTKRGWMFRAGVAKALYTGYGALELGFGAGFYRRGGFGTLERDGTVSGDETTFNLIPLTLALTYRADFIFEQLRVPLVPYVRAGLERYQWWITGGNDDTSKDGATNGWSAAGGLCLALDFFDPDLARELDAESGVNHTYLFVEVKKTFIDDFGSNSSWNLSDEKLSLFGGLMFVF